MVKNILLIILITFLIFFVYQVFFNRPSLSTVKINIKGKTYDLEVAKTVPQMTKGLMDRPTLCADCGMVFVSAFDLPQVFWMKNTLIPLDMIFLDHAGTVVNILTAVPQPGTPDSQLTLYRSDQPAKYVIELNAGDSAKLSLNPGDIIALPSL